ncbi:MAG: amidohydrolase family protein [Dehalococcoidia bacterium]|nr:amidohydrolase family protein [Dehalococcoidia bacterium]
MTHYAPAIDIVMNPYTTEFAAMRPSWSEEFLGGKIGMDPTAVRGLSEEALIAKLDRAGVRHAFLVAVRAGPEHHPTSYRPPYEKVAALIAKYPDRFSGLAGIDPTEGMRGVRQLEYAVKELGFIGAHYYPHWFELAPDHARLYPFYAKCVELDIPIQMQVGHCLRYSADRPLKSVGRPITLDTVACDFPELKLVGIHIGWPWTEEMIAVAYKHPNVYIGSDAYAPKHWAKEFVRYIDSWGQDKVLFGSDYPVIDPERARREIEELGLRPKAARKFFWENAAKLYKLAITP